MTLILSLLQLLGFVVIIAASSPVIAGLVWIAVSGSWAWGWLVLVVGALWGLGAAWIGMVHGGRALDDRGAWVLTTIRSWPGHEETR